MLRQLSPELQNIAKSELNEDVDKRDEDLKHIRLWLEKQSHLDCRIEDQWLMTFLRGCKFSLQCTKEKLDDFYTIRTLTPDFYSNRNPFAPEIQDILRAGILLPLPYMKDTTSPRIFMILWKRADPSRMMITNIAKVMYMIMDILMNEDDNCVISGVTVWEDCQDFNLDYVLQCTPIYVKKFFMSLQNTYPLRVKGFYVTNASSAVEGLFNLFSSLLTNKVRERFSIYGPGNFVKIYNHIPKAVVPKDFGGCNESVEVLTAQWKEKVESYKEWFLNDTKYRTNEKLRVGSAKTAADIFGIEGLFRELTID